MFVFGGAVATQALGLFLGSGFNLARQYCLLFKKRGRDFSLIIDYLGSRCNLGCSILSFMHKACSYMYDLKYSIGYYKYFLFIS